MSRYCSFPRYWTNRLRQVLLLSCTNVLYITASYVDANNEVPPLLEVDPAHVEAFVGGRGMVTLHTLATMMEFIYI